jgi:hypothetical protein
VGTNYTQDFTITVSAAFVPLTITTSTLPDGAIGISYSETLTATGTAPIIWSLVSGTPPEGLSLNSDRVISGTPTTTGTYTFTVKAANAAESDTKELSIKISLTAEPPHITTETLPKGTVETPYNQTLAATGTSPIAWTLVSGNLPAGLNLSESGIISGIPATEGAYTFTVKAQNSAGIDSKTMSITIGGVGINEPGIGNDALQVYPNPTTGILTIDNGALTIDHVGIFDIYGKNVSSYISHSSPLISINVAHLPAGMYILYIKTESGVVTKKVIKE